MSKVHATGIVPRWETRPVVGRRPLTPFRAAGMRTEPPVSVPSATGTSSAAVAAPDRGWKVLRDQVVPLGADVLVLGRLERPAEEGVDGPETETEG